MTKQNGTVASATIYSRKNGNSNKWDSLNQCRCRKTKMGSSAVNILGKVSNFLVTKLRHAKTTTDSELHVSVFHASFRLKSCTVPSEVVPTQLNSAGAQRARNLTDQKIYQSRSDDEFHAPKMIDSGY